MSDSGDCVLAIDDLVVTFPTLRGTVPILNRVSLKVAPGELVGIVGATGSGKSMTLLAIMGLLPAPGKIVGGSIRYGGRELIGLPAQAYRAMRGREIGMVVQNARMALNPLERVGKQIRTIYAAHSSHAQADLDARARDMLGRVGFRDVDRVLDAYPHQLSGGMAQRVLMAIALGSTPRIVLLDEPTSGLDPTIGARVMTVATAALREAGAAGIVVTHDLGVVTRYCDRAIVMSGGRVVDAAPVATFFVPPYHSERAKLIAAAEWAERAHEEGSSKAGSTAL
jgi:ABC-type dipeptide/oligopeptide/nickel transport system ATPase component